MSTKSAPGAGAQFGRLPAVLHDGDAENLPFSDASFDVVVSTFLFAPAFRDKVSALLTSTVKEILVLADAATPGAEMMLGRFMKSLLVEVLRRYAARRPGGASGWFAALDDPIVGRALQLVHADPARRWSLDDLAREAGSSRSALARRFNAVMGQAPIEYLTGWRMQLAAERLRNSNDILAAIAADVGYESEAAFNRAFKRVTGVTPGRWRDARLRRAEAMHRCFHD